jgi:Cu-Zn family superoxide dismutase
VNRHRVLPPLFAAVLVLAACGDDPSDVPSPTTVAPTTTAAPTTSTASSDGATSSGTTEAPDGSAAGSSATAGSFRGTLAEAASGGDAVTYDGIAAPVGAELSVDITSDDGKTTYKLTVSGMAANRGYAVHAHVNACGPTGDAAGPHFQHEQDPAATADKPSSDPRYANPENEVWLEVQTDGGGSGLAATTVPFAFAGRTPKSIVVHADAMTMTEPGKAGMACARIACLSTPLG